MQTIKGKGVFSRKQLPWKGAFSFVIEKRHRERGRKHEYRIDGFWKFGV